MTDERLSTPEHYAGGFQHFDEIPERYRLETYAAQYRGADTWEKYVEEVLLEEHDSKRIRTTVRLAGSSWTEHMQRRGRHHALASPKDVAEWCNTLLKDKVEKTCYEYYFLRIYDFYDHLKFSHRHPHLYNPLLLAAIDYDAPHRIWMVRVHRRRERAKRRRKEEASNDR